VRRDRRSGARLGLAGGLLDRFRRPPPPFRSHRRRRRANGQGGEPSGAVGSRPDRPSLTEDRMLSAYVFDRERGEDVENWAESLAGLSEDQVLWVDLLDPAEDEERAAREGFGLPLASGAGRGAAAAELELGDDFIRW